MGIEIVEISNSAEKSHACEQLTQLLPTWFGQPEANAHYAREIATKDVFGAVDGKSVHGIIAPKYHFNTTAETRARKNGCTRLALMTVSPNSPDESYSKTRLFYEALGFEPLVEFDEEAPHPMMWMVQEIRDL